VRCFIAAELPPEVKAAAGLLAEPFVRMIAGARPADPAAMHFTLRFLGEIGEGEAAGIGSALDALTGFGAFPVTLQGLGAFPRPEAARVLWTGASAPGAGKMCALARLASAAADSVKPGQNEDRPYVPHVTLARFRTPASLARIELFSLTRENVIGACLIDKVILFRSHLRPAGAEYEPLREVSL
jgi:2'-5' RNA ligase